MDECYGTIDYKLVCRTCLTADAEFYKLSAPIICDEDDEEKTSFQECLHYCTHLEDLSHLPIYICTECSTALQVTYNFIRNAVEAHEILRQKLCPTQQRNNGGLHMRTSLSSVVGDDENGSGGGRGDIVASDATMDKKMRFRCKVCNEKVETKKSLKQHVKLHLDIISYCCQMCNYESKNRSHLSNHYSITHGMEPTRDQLKPKTLVLQPKIEEDGRVKDARENVNFESFAQNDDEIYMQMEKIHNNAAIDGNSGVAADYDDDELLRQQRQQLFELEHQLELEKHQKQQLVIQHQQQQQQHQIDDDIAMTNVIPTVINDDNIQDFRNDFSIAGNELSIGNEFIVMADGSVEEVMENGVVIEYINAAGDGVTLENGLVLNNIVKVDQHTTSNRGNVDNGTNVINMDVDDIIIEENVNEVIDMPSIEDDIPQSIIAVAGVTARTEKKIKCKICADNFSTQEKLKTHMLTHNEIPHFFCDQCTFYTFFKIDLTQHYKTKHKLQPTVKQLQPKNKVKTEVDTRHIYTCDLCLFETYVKVNLRRHYLSKHQVEATDVQLRPTLDETDLDSLPIVRTPKKKQTPTPPKPDYPNGINCKKCFKTFYYCNKLKEHYKRHNLEFDVDTLELNHIGMENISKQQHQYQQQNNQQHQSIATMKYNAQEDYILVEQQSEHRQQTNNLLDNTRATDILRPAQTATTTNCIINNTPSLPPTIQATTTTGYSALPSDAIPQIVETDTAIDNDIDFDFNDALFEDFEDEDEENDNDDDDNEELQDLLLTSEDDFEDVLEEQQEQQQQQLNHNSNSDNILINSMPEPYCIHCNKKFFSQYQFENHMFVHRGLAPYRCEMCTNLYNTKRALIRHYTAVHKRVPTRDMIQAKGDKVSVDRTPVEHLNLQEQKAITLMCAKCPYESTELLNLQIHLSTSHGITDENFILQKLSFECPRCIRSYATKLRLIRHLERSHSVATIIQQHTQLDAAESLSPPPTATIPASIAPNSRCGIVELDINDEITINEENDTITTAPTATASTPTIRSIKFKKEKLTEKSHYNCKACDFICSTIELLNEHSKSHPSDDIRTNFNFECSICSCKYKTIEALKYHMKRHIARKYRCKQCPKSYINRGELNNHMLLHTGEMPHKCDMCNKKFRYSHHLKRHRDVLHYGKRFRCPTDGCERFFTTQAQMKIHTWTHNGNVPYKCKYCDRDFKKRESLRQHARKVHNVNLTEEEIAEIFRNTVGHTNPHDFTVSVSNGKMVRRSEVEAAEAESDIFFQNSSSNLPNNDDDETLD